MKKALLLTTMLALAQPAARPQKDQSTVIRSRVEVVNVICTVRDPRERYVTDLKKEDFEIREEGRRQQIDFFSNDTGENAQPLTVVLLLDTSGSVKEKLAFEQRAAGEFLQQTLRTNRDMAAVIQFDSEINLVQDFTYDHSTLENAIFDMRAGGATKLYDAIWLAVNDLLIKEVGRKALVVLSDGADTQSLVSDDDAIRVAQEEDVVIYAIGVRSRRFSSDFGKLEDFAKATGGAFFNSRADLERLRRAFSQINQEIKSQYSLGYVSTDSRRDGKFREIEVRVKRPRVKVNHRKGYYAPSPLG